jgi:hypothetical protein
MASPTVKLNSGYDMPIVGFGLWKVDNPVCAETVYQAIKAGYRLLDGACGMFYNSLATSAQNHLHPPPPPKKRIKKKKLPLVRFNVGFASTGNVVGEGSW